MASIILFRLCYRLSLVLGVGKICWALGNQILRLSSTMFRCLRKEEWNYIKTCHASDRDDVFWICNRLFLGWKILINCFRERFTRRSSVESCLYWNSMKFELFVLRKREPQRNYLKILLDEMKSNSSISIDREIARNKLVVYSTL